MSLFRLALAYARRRPLSTLLVVVLLAIGVATVALTLLLSRELEDRLARDAAGIDLVVGAKGSPLQLVLAGVYHVDVPPGNIPLASIAALRAQSADRASDSIGARRQLSRLPHRRHRTGVHRALRRRAARGRGVAKAAGGGARQHGRRGVGTRRRCDVHRLARSRRRWRRARRRAVPRDRRAGAHGDGARSARVDVDRQRVGRARSPSCRCRSRPRSGRQGGQGSGARRGARGNRARTRSHARTGALQDSVGRREPSASDQQGDGTGRRVAGLRDRALVDRVRRRHRSRPRICAAC